MIRTRTLNNRARVAAIRDALIALYAPKLSRRSAQAIARFAIVSAGEFCGENAKEILEDTRVALKESAATIAEARATASRRRPRKRAA